MEGLAMRRVIPLTFAWLAVFCYATDIHFQRDEAFVELSMMFYQFCHVSVWHLIANLAALYSIESSAFRTRPIDWIEAYGISAIFPCMAPTEGMSGLLYAMMGIISWQAASKWKFHLWCAGFMAICFLFPGSVNGWLHVGCYVLGVLCGKK